MEKADINYLNVLNSHVPLFAAWILVPRGVAPSTYFPQSSKCSSTDSSMSSMKFYQIAVMLTFTTTAQDQCTLVPMNSADYRVGMYIAVLNATTMPGCIRECYNRSKCSVLMHVDGKYCFLYEKGSLPMFILASAYRLHRLPPAPHCNETMTV